MRSSRKRGRTRNAMEDVRMAYWVARGLMRMRAGRAPWRSRR
jgi:hypothetical protein